MPIDQPLSRRPVQAWLALLLVAIVVALSWYVESAPAPRQASAPAEEFSAARAAGPLTRDALVAALAGRVERGVGVAPGATSTSVGTVENVVATVPGTASTGRVVLTAPLGDPALAEVARAMAAGPRPRNDVEFLFTDGADGGPVGVAAAVTGGAPGVLVAARGPVAAPPASVVATTSGAGALLAAVGGPLGSSLGPATASFLPDRATRPYLGVLDVADRAGWAGLALGSGPPAGDPTGDAALQQHGDTLLAMARDLGDRDVAELTQRSTPTFLTIFGRLVAWTDGWLVALALTSVVALFVLATVVVRRRASTTPRLVGGVVAALVALLAGNVLGAGLTQLVIAVRPGFATADPGGVTLLRAGVGMLAAVVVLVGTGLLRGRSSGVPLAFGGLTWLTVGGVVLAGLVPGAAFVATVPALAGTLGLLAVLVIGPSRPGRRLVVATVAAAVSALVLLGAARATLTAGVVAASPTVVLAVAFGLLVVPILATAVGGRRRLVPFLAVLACAALVVGGLQVARFDAEHPQPTALSYVADASAGTTRWVSPDARPPAWTSARAPQPAAAIPPLPFGAKALWAGAAPPVPLAAPEATIVATHGAAVTLAVRSLRGAPLLVLDVDRAVTRATVDGREVPVASSGDPAWPFRLQLVGAPPAGARIELAVADPAGLRFSVADATPGLGAIPGWAPPPPDVTSADRSDADLVVVSTLAP